MPFTVEKSFSHSFPLDLVKDIPGVVVKLRFSACRLPPGSESGSVSQDYGSADQDPKEIFTGPCNIASMIHLMQKNGRLANSRYRWMGYGPMHDGWKKNQSGSGITSWNWPLGQWWIPWGRTSCESSCGSWTRSASQPCMSPHSLQLTCKNSILS